LGTRYKPISFSRLKYNINANNPPPITAVTERLRHVMGPFDSVDFLGGGVTLQYVLVNPGTPNLSRYNEPRIYEQKKYIPK
jgi:hypothetical protein